MQNTQRDEASEFYGAKPWLNTYGEDVPRHLEPLPFANLADLVKQVSKEFATKTAFTVCLDNGLNASLTFKEVDRLSDAFAAYLRFELGLKPGDRVAIQMPNCLAYPIATFGIFKAGGVVVNVNPLYTAPEMNKQLRDSQPRALVIIDLFADKLKEGLEGAGVERVVLASITEFFPTLTALLVKTVLKFKGLLPGASGPTISFSAALSSGQKQVGRHPEASVAVNRKLEDLAVLQYTGGTTGVAKGAELTHSNLLSNVAQIQAVAGPVIRRGEESILTALPLYHIFAFTFNMVTFYFNGCHNILCPSPRPPSNLRKAFEKFRVTKFTGVNALFHGLANEQWFKANPPHIDLSISGGTALHQAVADEWKDLVGSDLFEGYGLSETSPVVAVNQPTGENRAGTIGLPVPGTDILVVDEQERAVPPGEVGELCVKGPQVMRGYWKRPDETSSALRNGWFHTGDMATVSGDGFVRIVDRKKDMIDVSGFNVYPNEVEDVLAAHPDIDEAAVIGIPNADEGGETVRAYVVTRNPNLTPEDIIAYAREKLTRYKVPKEIVFRDELPKTPVGKILRKDLRREALEGQGKS